MNCKFCGARLNEGGTVCPDCGREQREPYAEGDRMPPKLSLRKFWRERYFHKAPIFISGVLCLASAALTFYIGYNTPTIKLLCLMDVALILGCGFFITLFRSRLFSVLLAIYAVAFTVLTFVRSPGLPPLPELALRILLLATAFLGVSGTFRFRCRYQRYKREYRLRATKER